MSDSNSIITGNFFAALPPLHDGESFEEILRCRNVRIERIVSSARPDPTLYDQPQDEWVCLLQGEAELWVAGQGRHLKPGDHCFIPAHTPHRVVRTSAEPPCIWLAVHIDHRPGQAGVGPSQAADNHGKVTESSPLRDLGRPFLPPKPTR